MGKDLITEMCEVSSFDLLYTSPRIPDSNETNIKTQS